MCPLRRVTRTFASQNAPLEVVELYLASYISLLFVTFLLRVLL
jgi:hypothetical protein